MLCIVTYLICMFSSSNSPESGLGTSHTSLPGVDSDPDPDQYDGTHLPPMLPEAEGEYYEADLLPALGTCKALYPFEGTVNIAFIC